MSDRRDAAAPDQVDKRIQILAEEHANRTAQRAGLLNETSGFINPYHFIPLRETPDRSIPIGHHLIAGGRFSGRIKVRFTARSPLALSGDGKGTEKDPFRPVRVGSDWILPGSSIAGPIRSFHEALTNSCMRVVDRDYVPVHRDPAQVPDPARWRMAVVTVARGSLRVSLGKPIGYKGAQYPAVWVEARHLTGRRNITSADRFHFDQQTKDLWIPPRRGRLERKLGPVPVRCEDASCKEPIHWRTIVTQPIDGREVYPAKPNSGRHGKPRRRRQHPYHLPFAPFDMGGTLALSDAALAEYEAAAHDALDVAAARRGQTPTPKVLQVGRRQQIRERPFDGQVLWAKLAPASSEEIERLFASVLWRSTGQYAVKDRIGGHAPCSGADMCPSCRLFGMVEERDAEEKSASTTQRARVAAYKGHVRFSHATIEAGAMDTDPIASKPDQLREFGAPRPSAGQFYLDNQGWEGQSAQWRQDGKSDRPLREWGSKADQGQDPRPIRGRKQYWISTESRHPAGAKAHDQMSKFHRLASLGTTLSFDVWFDNVSSAQLGSLLVALNPNLLRYDEFRDELSHRGGATVAVALEQSLGHQVGKGKGVGLGAVEPEILEDEAGGLSIWGAERYTGADVHDEQFADPATHIRDFLQDAPVEQWAPLLAMKAIDWVPHGLLEYPPDDDGTTARNATQHRKYRFDFWKKTSGAARSPHSTSYEPVLPVWPDPDTPDVRVPRPWLRDGW